MWKLMDLDEKLKNQRIERLKKRKTLRLLVIISFPIIFVILLFGLYMKDETLPSFFFISIVFLILTAVVVAVFYRHWDKQIDIERDTEWICMKCEKPMIGEKIDFPCECGGKFERISNLIWIDDEKEP